MTVEGTVNKTFVLLAIVIATASETWSLALNGADVGISDDGRHRLCGLVLAIATTFKTAWSLYTAPLYAACGGAGARRYLRRL